MEQNITDFKESDKVDVIGMNPPYGGSTEDSVKSNFPMQYRSSETADLFIALIMYRLKAGGRCGVIIPDGFLFGTDGAKLALKEKFTPQVQSAYHHPFTGLDILPIYLYCNQHSFL